MRIKRVFRFPTVKFPIFWTKKKKTLDKLFFLIYNIIRCYGGIAQLARACGSYPQCQWFKSTYRYHYKCSYRSRVPVRTLFLFLLSKGKGCFEAGFGFENFIYF